MSIISAIGSVFAAVGNWFGKAFKGIKDDGAKLAIIILEGYKTEVANGVVPVIAKIIDALSGTHLAEDAVSFLNKEVPKLLAVGLSIQGLADNATTEQIAAFEDAAFTAFTGLPPNATSRFYTTFSADIFNVIHQYANDGKLLTYAELAAGVETAYQAYKKDLADEAANKADEANNQ